tara:strand:+ start:1468 stop:1794 length:327 start_codon:yes stop_codon:yes gene_type:complete
MPLKKRPARRRPTQTQDNTTNVGTGILDLVSKYGTFLGIGLIAYLQTMFPSKEAFMELEKKLNNIDKQLTEIKVIQKNVDKNTEKLDAFSERLRLLELDVAKQKNNNN